MTTDEKYVKFRQCRVLAIYVFGEVGPHVDVVCQLLDGSRKVFRAWRPVSIIVGDIISFTGYLKGDPPGTVVDIVGDSVVVEYDGSIGAITHFPH